MPSLVVSPLPQSLLATHNLPVFEDLSTHYFTMPTLTHPSSATLPKAYIWPEQDRPLTLHDDVCPSLATNDIPIIDMADDIDTTRNKLVYACEEWGVFYIVNHGVPLGLLERVREKGLKLFSLPLTTKMQALRKPGTYEGFGKAMIGKFFDSLMWSEGFTMMGFPTTSIADTTSKLCGADGYNEFREAFEEYDKVVRGVAGKLMRAILEGLGVDIGAYRRAQYDVESEGQAALQLNYYPPCPQPDMTMGLPAHTDSTCLTILQQGDVPGLEMLRGGRWTLVPPLHATALVVHAGDMLQVLSNGKYKSIIHRAIANKTRPRLSMACLCFPPITTTIAPPKEIVSCSECQRPLYKPFKWGDYLQAKSKYFMNALDLFKDS